MKVTRTNPIDFLPVDWKVEFVYDWKVEVKC